MSRDVMFNESIFPCNISNTKEYQRPGSASDFVIGGNTQIEVEQQDPPIALTP